MKIDKIDTFGIDICIDKGAKKLTVVLAAK